MARLTDYIDFDDTPLPSVGRCADLYRELRDLRLQMEKETARVQKAEARVREHIIANLSKSSDTGAAGLKYRAQIVTKQRPTVSDFQAFGDFVMRNGRLDLLQRRINDKAVMEMLDAGEKVAGVEKMTVVDVSITKL